MIPIAVVVFGLFLGSFLNVCIYRIPRKESIAWPGSHCPHCGNPVKPWDNIPVLSYLFLRGRCRHCGERISPRYPLVECLSALLALSMLCRFGLSVEALIFYFWACALLVVTFIDLDLQIIPDSISIGGIVVGFCLVPWMSTGWLDALYGMLLGGGLLLGIIYGYLFLTGKEGMGGGDVKLLAMIGVFTGWHGVLFTIFAASLVGSVVGVSWMLIKRKGLQTAIPFGPFLALGAYLYVLTGPEIISWYFGLVPG